MAGESFKISDDKAILGINSPRKSVGGPYQVIFKNEDERWAIVALNWEGKPNLGMRWFWGTAGTPMARGNGAWLIIPSELVNSILDGLPLNFQFRKRIEKFLNNEIKGSDL